MNKFKKMLAMAAAMTMVFTVGAMTACNDNNEKNDGDSSQSETPATKKAYVVTVLMPDGSPAAGRSLNFCVGTQCQPVTTDENGVAKFEFDDESVVYHVECHALGSAKELYSYTDFNTTPGQLEYTMTLNAPEAK